MLTWRRRFALQGVLVALLTLELSGLAGADALAGLRVQGATLEDVFLALTGRAYRA